MTYEENNKTFNSILKMKLNLSDLNFKNNILDCTLRDGGYYNNWLFSNKLIREYIRFVEKIR